MIMFQGLRTLVFGLNAFVVCAMVWPLAASPQNATAAQPRASLALDASIYRLAAGDAVKIDVYGEPELSLKLVVEPTGTINYPFLGKVRADGLTAPELQAQIAKGLRSGYLVNPDVRVSVSDYRAIYVTGQVKRAGAYPYSLGLTVQQALTIAGGPTDYASLNRIYIRHENAPNEQRRKSSLDGEILPGDTIIVEERAF